MNERILEETLRSMAPNIASRISSSTEQDLHTMLTLAVDYALRYTDVGDSALEAAIKVLRSGNLPDAELCLKVQASVERLDYEYLVIFKETESDRSKDAPWLSAWRRYTAAMVIASACATNLKGGLLSALYECLALQRQSGRSDLEALILSYRK